MSPLKLELINLSLKIRRERNSISRVHQEFFIKGGVCCPFCGVEGFTARVNKQNRRVFRYLNLLEKLGRDSRNPHHLEDSKKRWLLDSYVG